MSRATRAKTPRGVARFLRSIYDRVYRDEEAKKRILQLIEDLQDAGMSYEMELQEDSAALTELVKANIKDRIEWCGTVSGFLEDELQISSKKKAYES